MRRNSRRRAQDRRQPSREGKATPASARLSVRTSSALSAELFRASMTGFCHFRKKSGDGNEGLRHCRRPIVGLRKAYEFLYPRRSEEPWPSPCRQPRLESQPSSHPSHDPCRLSSAATGHVRFTPKSGHVQCTRPCLLWATSGHWPKLTPQRLKLLSLDSNDAT
jgi:hypothetical protein